MGAIRINIECEKVTMSDLNYLCRWKGIILSRIISAMFDNVSQVIDDLIYKKYRYVVMNGIDNLGDGTFK